MLLSVLFCTSEAQQLRPNIMREEATESEAHFMRLDTQPSPQQIVQQKNLANAEQIRLLIEMNHLTVELAKRRTDPYTWQADTPKLVDRLKKLSKRLNAG